MIETSSGRTVPELRGNTAVLRLNWHGIFKINISETAKSHDRRDKNFSILKMSRNPNYWSQWSCASDTGCLKKSCPVLAYITRPHVWRSNSVPSRQTFLATGWTTGARSPIRAKFVWVTLGPSRTPIQWCPQALSPEVTWQEYKSDHWISFYCRDKHSESHYF